MLPEEAGIADHQRRRFNELVDVFDRPQPQEVMARLREIVSSAGLRPGEVVLDVGTGVGVLIPFDSDLAAGCGVGLRRGRKDVAAGSEQIPSNCPGGLKSGYKVSYGSAEKR